MAENFTQLRRAPHDPGIHAPSQKVSPTDRQLALILLAFFAFQLFIYREAFQIKPSADDYILAGQIRLGEQAGPWEFFSGSPLRDYRPLQSITYWAVGRWAIESPFWLIHILNFVSFAFYALVFALWIRLTRMPLLGVLCAASVLFLHPILAGPLADLDGFARFIVSGWVWLGTYFAFRCADKLRYAIPLVSTCFLIGLGFMEYALGLIPLSVLAIWWGRKQERVRAAMGLASVLLALFAGYYLLRVSVIRPGPGYLSTDPITWAKNFVVLVASVLFMGNTVSVYVHQSLGALVMLAFAVLVMALMLLGGSWLWHCRQVWPPASDATGISPGFGFLCAAFLVSFIPMIFMKQVSEIYTSAIVIPLALQTGYAAVGWARAPRGYFIGFLVAFVTSIAWACTSVTSKVAETRETGDRATKQIYELLKWIPPEAHDLKVALVFLERELPPRRTYSVFRVGDDYLIQPGPAARSAIQWFRPGKNIRLSHFVVQNRSEVKMENFDMVLYWNPLTRRFELWKARQDEVPREPREQSSDSL